MKLQLTTLQRTMLLLAAIAMSNSVFAQADRNRDRTDKAARRPLAETRHRVLQFREQAADQAALAAMQERQNILNAAEDVIAATAFDQVLAAAAKPPADEVDARRARLQAHAAAFRDWVAQTLDWSAEQRLQLDEVLKEELRAAEIRWEIPPDNRRKKPLSDFAPIVFTHKHNTENFLLPGGVTIRILDMLTVEEQTRWFEVMDERRQSIRTANLDYIVSLVDGEIPMTPEDRNLFRDALHERIGVVHHRLYDLDTGLYSFGKIHGMLPRRSLDVLLCDIGKAVLTDEQHLLLQSLTVSGRQSRNQQERIALEFTSDVDANAVEVQLTTVLARERPRFQAAFAHEVAAAAYRWNLSDEQKRVLTVASKGVTERCLSAWKLRTVEALAVPIERLKVMREHVPQFAQIRLPVQGPQISSIDDDELWQHTLQRVKDAAVEESTREYQRTAVVGYVTGMLDKELWLTPDQRVPLRKLVDASFPQVIETRQPDLKEFELLVVPLFRIPEDQLATVLRESQLAAWKAMQNEFQRDGDTVALPTENGTVVFNLPQ